MTYFLDCLRPPHPAIEHNCETFEQWLNKTFHSLARSQANYAKHERVQMLSKTLSPAVIGTLYRNLIKNSVNADFQQKVTEQNAVQVLYAKVDKRVLLTAVGTNAFAEYNTSPPTITFDQLVTRLDNECTRMNIQPTTADGNILSMSDNSSLNDSSPSSEINTTFDPYWHESSSASSSMGNLQINFAGTSLNYDDSSDVLEQICKFEEPHGDGYYTDDEEELVLLTNFRNKKNIECWNCGKEGHISPDCPEKKGKSFRNKNFNSPRQSRFNSFRKSYPKNMFKKKPFTPRTNKGRTKFRPRRKFFRAQYKKQPNRNNRANFISDDIHSLEEFSLDDELESGYIYFFGDETDNGIAFHPLGYVTA